MVNDALAVQGELLEPLCACHQLFIVGIFRLNMGELTSHSYVKAGGDSTSHKDLLLDFEDLLLQFGTNVGKGFWI
eukprot:Skav220062  [mRNA]  locus=scaffold1709:117075:118731:+ [translate_table: standard]